MTGKEVRTLAIKEVTYADMIAIAVSWKAMYNK